MIKRKTLRERNLVSRLPPAIRDELQRKIDEEDYQDVLCLVQWLKDQGHAISKSSLYRHIQKLDTQILSDNIGELPAKPKPPAKMTLPDLERESGILGVDISRMTDRKKAIDTEIDRRYNGVGNPVDTRADDATRAAKTAQIEAVKATLLARQPVDQVQAIRHGWGLRLGSIIHRLRGKGWPIRTERDHGNGLARYSLPEGWEPPTPGPDTKKPL